MLYSSSINVYAMWVSNLLQNTNYRNSAEKPQQNTVKNHCEKALGA